MQRGVPDIFSTFLAFRYALKVFGFLPFKVNDKRCYERNVYYPGFFVLVFTRMLTIIIILGQQETEAEESLLVQYGNYLLYIQYTVLGIFVVIFNFLKRTKMANC
jgi:hypothetical protein